MTSEKTKGWSNKNRIKGPKKSDNQSVKTCEEIKMKNQSGNYEAIKSA